MKTKLCSPLCPQCVLHFCLSQLVYTGILANQRVVSIDVVSFDIKFHLMLSILFLTSILWLTRMGSKRNYNHNLEKLVGPMWFDGMIWKCCMWQPTQAWSEQSLHGKLSRTCSGTCWRSPPPEDRWNGISSGPLLVQAQESQGKLHGLCLPQV